ncbi:sensor histidine kinase [Hahella ganghwensis]|uniref:sensor histidine kinase n=1 Tax=Hahella ganghwensis TaxID=286420 RepID=UPI0003707F83|nr:sensor histidine kinase [Hahella ganghwensis]
MTDDQMFLVSMWITVFSATGVAVWLWLMRRQETALSALAGFCLAMAVWCFGHILVITRGSPQDTSSLGVLLLLSNPLLPTCFLHFVLSWLSEPLDLPRQLRRLLPLFYFTAVIVTLASYLMDGGKLLPWQSFPQFIHLQAWGWLNLGYTVFVGVLAHLILLAAFLNSRGNLRRSIIAMFATGAWGFILSTSFISPSVHFDHFPFPMLALPSYAVLVVYSLVRYRLVRVNRWVSFGVMFITLMTATMVVMSVIVAILAQLGVEGLARIPMSELVLYSALLLAVAWGLYRPMTELAERVVYPGGRIDQQTLNHWVTTLNKAEDWSQLVEIAQTLWTDKTGISIPVYLKTPERVPQAPAIACYYQNQATNQMNRDHHDGQREWLCEAIDWSELSPSHQRLGETFTRLLASACSNLERSLQLAETKQKRLEEKHLVELGGLTAAIAHELRNPLNIITMAATQTDPVIREHISNQVKRSELLIKDILSYAGRLDLKHETVDLCGLIRNVCSQMQAIHGVHIDLELPSSQEIEADTGRLQQVFINLVENAAAFVSQRPDGRILVKLDTEDDNYLQIGIHNNGPAISPEMHGQLFQPFVSKRAGGSGLGLAIVRRIIDAHQGRVWHGQDPDWPVSFYLQLPIRPPHQQPQLSTPIL